MGTGIGGGAALNQCASDFNKIEIRENRIARDAQEHEGRDRFIAKLNDIRLNYLRK